MPPIFIIAYALVCLAALFTIYFYILRYYGLAQRESLMVIFWCVLAGLILSVLVDLSSDQIGFIK